MIGNEKIWFVSPIRRKHFPGSSLHKRASSKLLSIQGLHDLEDASFPAVSSAPSMVFVHQTSCACSSVVLYLCLCSLYSLFLGHMSKSILKYIAQSALWILPSLPLLPCPRFFFLWADHSLLCITPPGVPVLYPLLLDNELFQGRARVFEVLYTPIVPNTGKEGQAPTKCILAKCFLSELIWLLNALMVICWTCTMYSSMLSIISFKHHQ